MDFEPTNSDMVAIQEIALKTILSIKCWPAGKADKETTEKTLAENNALSDSGRFTKRLVSKAKLKAIRDVATATRTHWVSKTVPWGESGERLVSGTIVIEFEAKMREFQRQFDIEYAKLESDYLQIVQDEQANLGSLYNPDDYPPVDKLRDKFGITFELKPIESKEDLRIKLSGPFVQRIQREAMMRERANLLKANEEVYTRLFKVVKHMVDRLSEKHVDPETMEEKFCSFKKTTITNVQDLVSIIPALNLSGDTQLSELAERLKSELENADPVEIRQNEEARIQVVERGKEAIDAIQKKMGFMFGAENDQDEILKAA